MYSINLIAYLLIINACFTKNTRHNWGFQPCGVNLKKIDFFFTKGVIFTQLCDYSMFPNSITPVISLTCHRAVFSWVSWNQNQSNYNCPIIKQPNEPMRTQSKYTWPAPSARNACDQVTVGFGFPSDWLRRWCEFFKPITERSKAKPKQFNNYFQQLIENRSNQERIILSFHISASKYTVIATKDFISSKTKH